MKSRSSSTSSRSQSIHTAAFVLDATGSVVASNQSARRLWRVAEGTLVGRRFVELVDGELGPLTAAAPLDWKAFSSELLEAWHPMTLRGAGLKRVPVRVLLERTTGGAGSYLAIVELAG